MTPQETVDAIARMSERRSLTRSPFHLAPCGGCGGPSFQQPCPLCAYYPMGDDRGTWHPETVTREYFCSVIDRSGDHRSGGNLATWFVRNLEKSAKGMAKSDRQTVVEGLRPMLQEAQAMRGLLSPAQTFELVSERRLTLVRPIDDGHLHHWRVLQDCRGLMRDVVEDVTDPRRRCAPSHEHQGRLESSMRRMLDAVHKDDHVAAAEEAVSIRGQLKGLARERHLAVHGNYVSAVGHLDTVVADGARPPAP